MIELNFFKLNMTIASFNRLKQTRLYTTTKVGLLISLSELQILKRQPIPVEKIMSSESLNRKRKLKKLERPSKF